ncbi:acyl-CoA synthetase [Mycolicibacterium tokaiense]|uniref:Fatty-acid-CoA ligase FadD36 n=1 Tax=Mycolicibacterium tokaiense TaxID=39695 RepID=A0A378TI52_9MYCO|nr:acyl-CoA synthetase [Mycolicibacterium tokaiense]BBY85173.1 acyl-CoA synthetase [Mycolicibacterium tokaiense]STZ60320.1 Fatty-acid-CoA ligase FadD36 [Mycolicibacterium tokaiense]
MTETLLRALRDRAEDRFVTVDGETLSHRALYDAASGFAAAVLGNGDAPVVAVCAVPTMTTVVAVTGALLGGVPVVPVPPDAGTAEVAHIVTDSGATCWVGPPRDGVDLPVLEPGSAGDGALPAQTGAPERPAMILYTSGTTGAPKGVLLSRNAIAAGIEGLADAWSWTAEDTVVHGLPLFHTHGLILGVIGSLHLGSQLIHTGKPTPERYAAAGGTMYFGVPTVWARIVRDEAAAGALASARLLVSGSAPLPVPVFQRLAELTGLAPVERYGMTETMITLSTRADGERRPGWVGMPIAGAQTRIQSDDGQPVPHDGESIGRLQVRGTMLFDGYLNLPDVTAACWTDDGWFVTGDLAAIDESGFHRIVGRESVDLIKSGGYRIGAGEIETSLLARSEVHEVAVIGMADDDLGQRIVAYVVSETGSGSEELAEQLIAHVADDLSWHKRPREVRFVSSLPRNAMGKVQKKALM